LTKIEGAGINGICVNAIDVNGGGLATSWACTSGSMVNTHIDFCGCVLRDGTAKAYLSDTYGSAHQYW